MDLLTQDGLRELIGGAFPAARPVDVMTLEMGNDIDSYRAVDPDKSNCRIHRSWPEIEDAYLTKFFWGFSYLDSSSWRFYLPRFMTFALAHMRDGTSVVIDACLAALRPPDREPVHLGSLTSEQIEVVRAFLEVLAFAEDSGHRDLALQVLEEGWVDNPLYPWRK